MGYAMSGQAIQGTYNYMFYLWNDDAYKVKWDTDSANQQNILYAQKFDTTNIHAVRLLCTGKKDTNASTDNHIKLDVGAYNEIDSTFTDTNEVARGGWSTITDKGKGRMVKLYLTGGSDYQYFRSLIAVLLYDTS